MRDRFDNLKRGDDPVVIDQAPDTEFPQPQNAYARTADQLPGQRTNEYDTTEPAAHEQEDTKEKSYWVKRAVGGVTLFAVLVAGGAVIKYVAGKSKETGSTPATSAPVTPGQTEPSAAEIAPTLSEAEAEAKANINRFTPVEMGGKPYVLEDARNRAFVPQQEAPTAKAAAYEIDTVYNNFARMKGTSEGLSGEKLVEHNQAILSKMFEGRDDIDPQTKQLLLDLNENYIRNGEYPDFKISGGTFDQATGTLNGATMKVTKYKRDSSGYEEPLKSFSYTYSGTVKLNSATNYWNFGAQTSFPMEKYK